MQQGRQDLAADPDAVESADVVVLHRVVCCYPDTSAFSVPPPTMRGVYSSSVIRRATGSRVS